jgi:hypothetical protein
MANTMVRLRSSHQAAGQDVPKFATGGSHSMVYDAEDA